MYIYMCIYIYIYRERERERDSYIFTYLDITYRFIKQSMSEFNNTQRSVKKAGYDELR